MLSRGRLKDGERIWFANLSEDNASLREQKPKLNSADYIIYETQVFQNLNQNRDKSSVLSLRFTVGFNRRIMLGRLRTNREIFLSNALEVRTRALHGRYNAS